MNTQTHQHPTHSSKESSLSSYVPLVLLLPIARSYVRLVLCRPTGPFGHYSYSQILVQDAIASCMHIGCLIGSMFHWSYISLVRRLFGTMYQWSYALMVLCFNGPVAFCPTCTTVHPIGPSSHWSYVQFSYVTLVLHSSSPTSHFFFVPLVQRCMCSTFHWSFVPYELCPIGPICIYNGLLPC